LEVAAYQLKIPDGDLLLAQDYLERVAASNAEDVARAVEMLKAVNIAMQAKLGLGNDEELGNTGAEETEGTLWDPTEVVDGDSGAPKPSQ
jgi:hypothetical protein